MDASATGAWRPLFQRGKPDPRFDEPAEGVPPYLVEPITTWIVDALNGPDIDGLRKLQLRFKLDPPLHGGNPLGDLWERCRRDGDFALEVVDYLLSHVFELLDGYGAMQDQLVGRMAQTLNDGGSAWEVAQPDSGAFRFALQRRAVGPVREALEAIPASTRAHTHLVQAWNRLSGRHPDPSSAYRESIRAVEAAAKRWCCRQRSWRRCSMIGALRDKPANWTTTQATSMAFAP